MREAGCSYFLELWVKDGKRQNIYKKLLIRVGRDQPERKLLNQHRWLKMVVIGDSSELFSIILVKINLLTSFRRFLNLSAKDLNWADQAFAKHGEIIIFIGRLLPAVRTFIAFPAGVARMNMTKFIAYTFVGSLIWCYLLALAGFTAGEHWESLKEYFHEFHYVIAAAGLIFVVWYVRRHFKHG